MLRVGFIGAPGSGKTVLAKRTSSELSVYHKLETTYADEYASVFVTKYRQWLDNGAPTVAEQYLILERQLEREREAEQKGVVDVALTDSPIFLNYVYASRVVRSDNPIDRIWLNRIHETMTTERRRYASIVVIPPRAESEEKAASKRVPGHLDPQVNVQIHTAIVGLLSLWLVPCVILPAASFGEQVKIAVEHICGLLHPAATFSK